MLLIYKLFIRSFLALLYRHFFPLLIIFNNLIILVTWESYILEWEIGNCQKILADDLWLTTAFGRANYYMIDYVIICIRAWILDVLCRFSIFYVALSILQLRSVCIFWHFFKHFLQQILSIFDFFTYILLSYSCIDSCNFEQLLFWNVFYEYHIYSLAFKRIFFNIIL